MNGFHHLMPMRQNQMIDFTRQSIIDLIHEDARLTYIWHLINQQLHNDDPSHDIEHILRVARWTNHILASEIVDIPKEQLIEATVAVLLHDFINVPKNHPDRAYASAQSADKAKDMFKQAGFSDVQSDEMSEAIRTHSFSRGERPTNFLGEVLQDADRLDALGAIGIFRCVAISAQMGAKFVQPEDPWAHHRPLDDRAFSVDHFFTKLFLLPEKMNTQTGRIEAKKRVGFMKSFLSQLGAEIGVVTS